MRVEQLHFGREVAELLSNLSEVFFEVIRGGDLCIGQNAMDTTAPAFSKFLFPSAVDF